MNDTKNKSIDEVLQNESKPMIPTKSLALFSVPLLENEEVKSAVKYMPQAKETMVL